MVHPYFQINPPADGTNDLQAFLKIVGISFGNYNFSSSGENDFIDDIDQTNQSTKILYNLPDNMRTGVMHFGDGFKTIGSSFEFGGLVDNPPYSTKEELLKEFFKFFGIFVTDISESNISKLPRLIHLYQNYSNPFKPIITIEFDLLRKTFVSLKIFNLLEEEITTLVKNELSVRSHQFFWDSKNTTTGVCFYYLETA